MSDLTLSSFLPGTFTDVAVKNIAIDNVSDAKVYFDKLPFPKKVVFTSHTPICLASPPKANEGSLSTVAKALGFRVI